MRQGGVFTAEQARAEGWTPRTIRRRIATGRWVYVVGRALAENGLRWTPFQLAMAARLTWPEVVVSHRTAAALHGFPHDATAPALNDFPADDQNEALPECDVITGSHRAPGLRLRAHHLRLEEDEVQLGPAGIRLTTPARTAVDCLAILPFEAAFDLWAWLVTRRILDQEGLRLAIDRRMHWYGTGQLRRIAEIVANGAASQAEVRLHELLAQAEVTGWIANAQVQDEQGLIAVADLLFESAKVIIEVDGWRTHRSRESFVQDRRRDRRLTVAGYRVLRFTWDDLINRPAQVIAEIVQAVRLGLEKCLPGG